MMTRRDRADLEVLCNAIKALEEVKYAGLASVQTRNAIGALRRAERDIVDSQPIEA